MAGRRADRIHATRPPDLSRMLTAAARVIASPALEDDERWFARLRAAEFARLDRTGECYLDYTGAALYPESLVRAHAERLACGIFGNPHSESPASRRSSEALEGARAAVLHLVGAGADEYDVCFAANASNAIRLVAESFPFASGGTLALSADNHNSVNGIREYAARAGAAVRTLPLDAELRLDRPLERLGRAPWSPSLLALPAQSNFSGVRHPLSLVREARARGWCVLLDAAAYVPTMRLDLAAHPADFVALSLYKIAGYPTGVGALVARREWLDRLQRPWFAGGTVEFVSVQHGLHQLRAGAAGFEDGTPSFLALEAVPEALAFVEHTGIGALGAHVRRLTRRLLEGVRELRHPGGAPVVVLHGPGDLQDRGGTIALNVLDRAGRVVPFEEIEREAGARGISLRGGCFCNPGAAEHAFAFPASEMRGCLERARAEGFDARRLSACIGRPVGAVRLSPGLATTPADVDRALELLAGWSGRALA